MPFAQLAGSPLAPGAGPIDVFYRDIRRDIGHDAERAEPLLILHGGWGYEFYPFDAQLAALPDRRSQVAGGGDPDGSAGGAGGHPRGIDRRFVIPDRTGYGRSPRIASLPARFHHAAAAEHEALLDALGIARCAIWGHSDGAVIAAIMGLRRPERVTAVILEALHLDRGKPRSRAFFQTMLEDPDGFGPRVAARLEADHGESWRTVLRAGGRAWLDIAATPDDDFFEHRLGDLAPPALILHGADDPRTEPDELDRVARALPAAAIHVIAGGGHSPHSERATQAEVTRIAAEFLASR